jgi:hypothetical protein
MKNKIVVIIVAVILLLCVCLYVMHRNCVFGSFCTSEEEAFKSSINIIYKEVKVYYNDNKEELTYGRIDGKSCNSFEDSISNINYYISFDNEGNMIEFYAYDKKYEIENKSENISINDLKDVVKYKDLIIDCNGKK